MLGLSFLRSLNVFLGIMWSLFLLVLCYFVLKVEAR